MTPKEAFEKIKRVVKLLQRKLETNEQDENMDIVDNALTEFEELKRDVKRYFELDYQAKIGDGIDNVEANEYTILHRKLSKVGVEDV